MKKTSGLFLVLFFLFTLACNAAGSTPLAPTNLPPTDVPPAPTPIPPTESIAPAGVAISARGTSFSIPLDVAGGAVLQSIPESVDAPDKPYWDIYPAHLQFDLNNYALQDSFHQPRIIIYPANEYAKMNEGAAQVILALQALLANPDAPLPENLPFLPLFNAAQVFYANPQILAFQNGTGIRYVTQYGQAPAPVNSRELFYTFQGVTSDGAYYVAAIMPIAVGFLPPNGNPDTPLPPNGIPFDWENFENMQAYFDAVTQKLNDAHPAEFLPALTDLDALFQSLSPAIE